MKASALDAMVNASLLRNPEGGNWPEAGLHIIALARLRNGYSSVKTCVALLGA